MAFRILAIDTTAKVASCAVTDGRAPVSVYSQLSGITHSETMLPMIKAQLDNLGLSVKDIDMFCVSAGPGSFTGVRIGVSLIKGLAFGSGKPCVGVSTLDALARNLSGAGHFIISPVMDARRGQVYNALFECNNGALERLTEDRAISADALVSELEALKLPVSFCGDGYDIMESLHVASAVPCPAAQRWQNAYSVALAGIDVYERAGDKSVFNAGSLSPVYLRVPQAERELAEKNQTIK